MGFKVVGYYSGELLGESEQRKGAFLMAELFQLRGVECYVVEKLPQRKPKTRYAKLRVELLEKRNAI
jgi:hypothetical protein